MTRKYCVNSAVIDGDNLVLTFSNTPVFSNRRCFEFTICPNIINPATAPTPVVVNMTVSGATAQVALWDNAGNPVYSNTLKRGVCYFGRMGNGTANHIVIYNTPCC